MALHFLSGSLLLLWLFIPFYVIGCCDIPPINYSWLKFARYVCRGINLWFNLSWLWWYGHWISKSIAQQRYLSTVTEFRGKLRICKQKLHTREQSSYHCSSKVWQIWCLFIDLIGVNDKLWEPHRKHINGNTKMFVGANDKKRHDEYCQCGIPHYYKFMDHLQLMSDCCI
jgi:hypothetical protein